MSILVVVITAANVSSVVAAVRSPPPYPLLLTMSGDSVSYFVLIFTAIPQRYHQSFQRHR